MLTEPLYSTTRTHKMNRLGNESDCVIEIMASVIWVTQLKRENRWIKMEKSAEEKEKEKEYSNLKWKKCVDVRHWHLILMPELASRFSRARSIKVHSLGPFFISPSFFWLVSFFFWWLKCREQTGKESERRNNFVISKCVYCWYHGIGCQPLDWI